jgi:hypothetical protein
MEPKLAVIRVNISREAGEVMIFMKTACGFKPVIGWPDMGAKEEIWQSLPYTYC